MCPLFSSDDFEGLSLLLLEGLDVSASSSAKLFMTISRWSIRFWFSWNDRFMCNCSTRFRSRHSLTCLLLRDRNWAYFSSDESSSPELSGREERLVVGFLSGVEELVMLAISWWILLWRVMKKRSAHVDGRKLDDTLWPLMKLTALAHYMLVV